SGGMVPGGSVSNANERGSQVGLRTDRDWRGYDDVAETYERVQTPRAVQVATDLVALARPPDGGKMLDVGAGTGSSTQAAQETLGSPGLAVGVDSSLGMLAVAARVRPETRLVAAEAIDLPFHDATFDTIIANFVIAHFTRYE